MADLRFFVPAVVAVVMAAAVADTLTVTAAGLAQQHSVGDTRTVSRLSNSHDSAPLQACILVYKSIDLYLVIQNAKNVYAVLVADVVKSSSQPNIRPLLYDKLESVSRSDMKQGRIRLPYSVTAGDEFQAISDNIAEIPLLLWELRMRLRPLSFRVGIGIGGVRGRIQPPVNRLAGEAFILARKAIDATKRRSAAKLRPMTVFRSEDSTFNTIANLIYVLQDTLLARITPKQWETIEAFSKKRRLEDAAKELNLDASTISRNLKRGNFWQIDEAIAGMRVLIKHSFL